MTFTEFFTGDLLESATKITREIQDTPWIDLGTFGPIDANPVKIIIEKNTKNLSKEQRERVQNEFFGPGPIQTLLQRTDISEIIINGPPQIWIERNGRLEPHNDHFFSDLTFKNFIHFVSKEINIPITLEKPFASGNWNEWRVHISGNACTHSYPAVSIRKPASIPWTLENLMTHAWCAPAQADFLKRIIIERENIIVVGPTSAGKTSVLSALMSLLPKNERVIILEDTAELAVPNACSTKLVSRSDPQALLPEVTLSDLVKQSLRMRPDRLIMGEVRGPEAKDLLLSLSTGHSGSMGTLHARSGQEAMLRLEMLVQLGAPEWALTAIRRLIFLALKYIVVVSKNPQGLRYLEGIYKIASLEEFGFLLDRQA